MFAVIKRRETEDDEIESEVVGLYEKEQEARDFCRLLNSALTVEASTAQGSHDANGKWFDACIADYSYVVREVPQEIAYDHHAEYRNREVHAIQAKENSI